MKVGDTDCVLFVMPHIGQKRLNSYTSHLFTTGTLRTERHGGARLIEKHTDTKTSIIDHIKKLRVVQSHLGHGSLYRQYLSPTLNVRRICMMWKLEEKKKRSSTIPEVVISGLPSTSFVAT